MMPWRVYLGFPIVELNTISSKFGLTAITEREHQFIREYCTVMKPLTVALDILQGEDHCFHGTLLPTLETLIFKTLQLKSGLHILIDLPEAIVTVRTLIYFRSSTHYPINSFYYMNGKRNYSILAYPLQL